MLRNGTAFVDVKALVPGEDSTFNGKVHDTHPDHSMFVQAGAFSEQSNAEHLLQQLRDHGYSQVFVRNDVLKGHSLYRVDRPISSVDEFDTLIAKLKLLGINDAHLALD